MSRSTEFLAALLTLALAAACGNAGARSSDRNQPMDIEAAKQDCGLGSNDSCTLTDATMTQGTLRVRAAKAVIQQVNGEMSRILMSGGVVLRQETDEGDTLEARSANIDYDLGKEVMVLTGNVVITQSRGNLRGERVVYDMKSGRVESGGEGNGRVRMRILPKTTPASTGKGAP